MDPKLPSPEPGSSKAVIETRISSDRKIVAANESNGIDLFEIIGFLILILFLLGPVLRKLFGKKGKKKADEPPPPAQPQRFARPSIAKEVQQFRPPPPPEPLLPQEEPPQEPYRLSTVARRHLHPDMEEYTGMEATGEASFTTSIGEGEPISEVGLRYTEDEAYRARKEGASKIARLLQRPRIGKEMVLLHEVLSSPKSLGDY